MPDKKKHNQDENRTPNISAHYYTDPIYGSSTIYGIDEYADADADIGTASGQAKDEPRDEPPESWGWINNVD
ncbi:MAG: hypothetical protein ACOY4Q_13300 [Bacillota bacterium]